LLGREVEAARETVRRQAAMQSVERLLEALRAKRAGDAAAILRAAGGLTPEAAEAAARALVDATTSAAFLGTLRGARFGAAATGAETRRIEHVLLEGLRGRFGDRPAVAQFLAASYAAWARELHDERRPGLALYALERAEIEGGAPDPALGAEARGAMARDLGLTLLLAVEQAPQAAPVPAEGLLTAARAIVEKAAKGFVEIVEFRPVGAKRQPLELVLAIGPVSSRDDPTEETASARYQKGWETVRNPEYDRAAAELRDAQAKAAEADQRLANMRSQGNNDAERVFWGILAAGVKAEAERARERVAALQQQLAGLRPQLRREVYDDEPYRRITHDMACTASATASVRRGRDDLAPWAVWEAEVRHRTLEVVGNPARNVPVQKPAYPPAAEVAAKLGLGLVASMQADAVSLVDRLEVATFTALEQDLEADGAGAALTADRRWGLARLWRTGGVAVRQIPELERAVRAQLGLPAAEQPIADAPAVAPVPTAKPLSPVAAQPAPSAPPPFAPGSKPVVAPSPARGAAPAAPPPAKPEPVRYQVRAGESLKQIADRFGVTTSAILEANPGLQPRRLRIGQVILIPRK
jgi:hypothetical protein